MRVIYIFLFVLSAALFYVTMCDKDDYVDIEPLPTPNTALRYDFPRLFIWPEEKDSVSERLQREPYISFYNYLKTQADRDYIEIDPDVYDGQYEQVNASTAKDNAFIAYMENDSARADKAIEFLLKMRTDPANVPEWDDDIHVAQSLHGFICAYDLLKGTDFLDESVDQQIYNRFADLTSSFYNHYTSEFPIFLQLTQNNHNLKTACAIGMAGIVLSDHPDAWKWLGFGMTETQALIDMDLFIESGGYGEGPNYLEYGMIDVIPFLIAYHRNYLYSHYFTPVCSIRYVDVACTEEAPILIDNLLLTPEIQNTMKWDILIRLPDGNRPTFDDASNSGLMTGILAPVYDDPVFNWDFENFPARPYFVSYLPDYAADYICLYDDTFASNPPSESPTLFLEDAGQIIFKNSWDTDSLYFLMLGENGGMRCMGHEHSDPTSFLLYGYGQYLLQDNGYPGYDLHELTMKPEHHNMILVDGNGPLTDIALAKNGSDGFIQNTISTSSFDYAEVSTTYQNVDFIRGALFAGKRYIIIHDRVSASASHTYSYYLHGYAGGDLGGTFNLNPDGADWENANGKVKAWIGSTKGNLTFTSDVGDNACYRTLHTHNFIKGDIASNTLQFLAVLYPAPLTESFADTTISYPASNVCVMSIELSSHDEIAVANATGSQITVSVAGFETIKTSAAFIWIALDNGGSLDNYFIQDNGTATYGSQSLNGNN